MEEHVRNVFGVVPRYGPEAGLGQPKGSHTEHVKAHPGRPHAVA